MNKIILASILFFGIAASSEATYIQGPSISTTTGRATYSMAGTFSLASSSVAISSQSAVSSTYTIILNGSSGSIVASTLSLDNSTAAINSTTTISLNGLQGSVVATSATFTYNVFAGSFTGIGAQISSLTAANISAGNVIPGVKLSTANISPAFNGASNLVQMDSSGKLPAIDGSQLTNLAGLQSNSTSTISAAWTFVSSLTANGGLYTSTKAVTAASYTVGQKDVAITCDATANAQTITLPALSGSIGRMLMINKFDSSVNTCTISGAGSDKIAGTATIILGKQYSAILIWGGQDEWHID